MDSSIYNLKDEVEFFIKVFHQMRNAFLSTVSFLAIGALVFRWTKASVTFVFKSVGMESVHKCSGVKTRFKSRYLPFEVVSGNDTLN